MIHPDRIAELNDRPVRDDGPYVLYWMQASQREHYNHALEHAVSEANRLGVPTVVAFGLTENYPRANRRHYAFMLEGLAETHRALADRGIAMVVRSGHPPEVASRLAEQAAMVVADRGYLRHQRQWRDELADRCSCRVVQVEADVVIPIEAVSDKQEYAARMIRPKIHRQLAEFLQPMQRRPVKHRAGGLALEGLSAEQVQNALGELTLATEAAAVGSFRGGTAEARKHLQAFIAHRLARYGQDRNDPHLGIQSNLSPYLHFGQVSPVWVALEVQNSGSDDEAVDAFLEELIVRRELSCNYVFYNPRYDRYAGLPDWARKTLAKHKSDRREVTYSRGQLESAQTHDPYWNAAQHEMLQTGKMHNYMRMYWGKKILEWSADPAEAFAIALELNDRYELDGRDPNSYVGVGWCFGLHDRPWQERAVFGQVRYMNDRGLRRKFDMQPYVDRWTP